MGLDYAYIAGTPWRQAYIAGTPWRQAYMAERLTGGTPTSEHVVVFRTIAPVVHVAVAAAHRT